MMKQILTLFLFSVIWLRASSQGTVAIGKTVDFCTMSQGEHTECTDKWLLNVNNRYVRTFRHFVRTDYEINIGRSLKF